MLVLRSLLRAVPRPLRRALRRVADRCVPLRWQLPYISAKLYLQGGLEEELLWLPRILRERGGNGSPSKGAPGEGGASPRPPPGGRRSS